MGAVNPGERAWVACTVCGQRIEGEAVPRACDNCQSDAERIGSDPRRFPSKPEGLE